MEFEEVSNFIKRVNDNVIVRKPTLSNFVQRLKQQSSKARFVREYKRLAAASDSEENDMIQDQASIRIIDPTTTRLWTHDPEEEESSDGDDSEEQVATLGIKTQEKKPMNKRVNMIQSQSNNTDQFLPFDVAIGFINQDICDKNNEIMKQIKRIEMRREEITKYKQDLLAIQKQMDFFHSTLATLKSDHLPDMKLHQVNAFKSAEKLKENKKKNVLLKSRFNRYLKAISLDTRLMELEKKIKAAWRRDEVWTGLRDWGFLSVLLFSLMIVSIIAWTNV